MTAILVSGLTSAVAQSQVETKFDKVTCDFGTPSDDNPVHKTIFTLINIGEAPLVINQTAIGCGRTIPSYDKKPIASGQRGMIDVIYDGTGRFPGYFKKSITVYTNGKVEMTRLYTESVMIGK